MLHILLLILKIIGIILGTLLAALFIGLCLALFVPVRYRIEAERTEEEGAPPIEVEGTVTWLLHFVNIRFRYPAEVYLRARIFVFTVFRLPSKKKAEESADSGERKKGRKSRSGKKEKNKAAGEENGGETFKEHAGEQEEPSGERDREPEVLHGESDGEPEKIPEGHDGEHGGEAEGLNGEHDREPEEPKEKPDGSKLPLSAKIKAVFSKVRKIFQNIWYTLTGICDKIKTIWENIEYYMDVLRSDAFQNAFSLCKGELYSIFSYIRPRKFQADLIIGMDDPAATGKILSYYGMLYPLIGEHVNIVSDFERKRLEGNVLIKGKVKLFTFIKAAVRIYFSKDVRKLLSLFKKEDI